MRNICFICLSAAVVLSSQTEAQTFSAYYGKDSVHEGNGGEMHVVEGIEFWSNGEPPKKVKLIGFVTDDRHKSGLFGMMRMSGLEKDVALVAKKAGGEAVILVSSEAETTGYVGNAYARGSAYGSSASAQGFSTSHAVQTNHSRFAVIQYVKNEPDSSKTSQPGTKNSTPNSPSESPSSGSSDKH